MTLKDGKFYNSDGQVVPLEFGNKEQIALLDLSSALNGDGVCMTMVSAENQMQFLFQCLCGEILSPKIKSTFKCKCGNRYKCFDTYYMPAVKFAK